MYIVENLFDHAIVAPYEEGYRNVRILSGYASSAFLTHLLTEYPDLEIELVIGMARKDGIRKWDHERYIEIANRNPNITIHYHVGTQAIHTKVYHWTHSRLINDSITFIGSANFSWNGFRDQGELLAQSYHLNVEDIFDVADTISCTDPNVEQHIRFNNIQVGRRTPDNTPVIRHIQLDETGAITEYFNLRHLPYVDLSLLLDNDTAIHERSGLNWGQRPGRERNQAYIPVSVPFNNANPDFFPPLEQAFTMVTDDGQQLICIMAQQNRKAIHTTESNSIMGRYFRNRLGVPLGARVDAQDLIIYGRTSVRVYKIDNETYFMDYGTAPAVTEIW